MRNATVLSLVFAAFLLVQVRVEEAHDLVEPELFGRAERRLLDFLVQVALLDAVLGAETAVAYRIGQRHGALSDAHLGIRELRLHGIEAELLSDGLAQLAQDFRRLSAEWE
ncbi:hypothetical protein QRQ56_30720 [Bradyrhizobium sp. U531]|uniref:hypothetical protein n=1 Tax=Bradyrhizobium sp. U531 TaxID=3053458 RepID=UPI003F444733